MYSESFLDSVLNIESQWGKGILAMAVAANLAFVIRKKNDESIFYLLMLASSIPIIIHLILICNDYFSLGYFPWGSWGRETHHAELANASGQTVLIASLIYLFNHKKNKIFAIIIIAGCLFSMIVAQSRGGFIFSLFAILVPATIFIIDSGGKFKKSYFKGIISLLIIIGLFSVIEYEKNPRWQNTLTDLKAGMNGGATEVMCNGFSSIDKEIQLKYGDQAERIIFQMREGDALRILALRTGFELSVENPFGWNASRHAFKKLLENKCENPSIEAAHTHNGWLDTALALGWLGVFLLAILLISYLRIGFMNLLKNKSQKIWSILLISTVVFWIARGFFDSVFRDYMLQMQGFLISFAYCMMIKNRKEC
jgi:hypothetical protein